MHWRPDKRRQNIGDIEVARRHFQNAGKQGDKGAHNCCEARQENARNAILANKLCAALDQPRKPV
jgi:hypothetical protein